MRARQSSLADEPAGHVDPYATPIRHARESKRRLNRGTSFLADLESDIVRHTDVAGAIAEEGPFKPAPPGSPKPGRRARLDSKSASLEAKLEEYNEEMARRDSERTGAKKELAASRSSAEAAKKPVRATGMEPHIARQGKRALNRTGAASWTKIAAHDDDAADDAPPLVRRSGGGLAATTSAHRVMLDAPDDDSTNGYEAVDEEEDSAAALSLPTMLLGYRSPQRALCRMGFLGLQRLEAKGAVKKAVAAHNALLVENGQKRAETLAQTVSGGVRTHAIAIACGFNQAPDSLTMWTSPANFERVLVILYRVVVGAAPSSMRR